MEISVVIIGAGNLATRVSLVLQQKGATVVQVYSRSVSAASTLAHLLHCPFTTDPSAITSEADIYLIAVADSALELLLPEINFNNKLIVHTAGSISVDVLKNFSANYGVFYPLQTFSKAREVDFSSIPICIEANSVNNEQRLVELGKLISRDVRIINSEQRKQLHLAAVFACNFVNHLYALSEEIIFEKGLTFDILRPLITETAAKVEYLSPRDAQTGPAKRADGNVMEEHLAMLDNNKHLKGLYQTLSDSILTFYNQAK
jgi:predicted short-subunit dehydrogenase-like oxidoreductase (DUF2520 family)